MSAELAWKSEDSPAAQQSAPFSRSSHSVKRSRRDFSKSEMPISDSGSRLSINRLKKQIRDTTRVLNHSEKLPAGVRLEKERALVGYQHDLEQAALKKRRQRMITKYHMVRFFGQYALELPCHSCPSS